MAGKTVHHQKTGLLQPVTIAAGVQFAVLGMLAVAWLGSAALTGLTMVAADGGFGWSFFGWTVALPALFFVTALLYVWRKYQLPLQKLFVSGVLAASGFLAAQLVIQVLFLLNNHFSWIATDVSATSATIHSLEWLVVIIAFAAYVAVLGLLPHDKKKEA